MERRPTCGEPNPASGTALGERSLDAAGLEILGRSDCLAALSSGGVGRIAINVGALPRILPVRFVLDGERVVLRVREGSTLDRATRDTVVAFEADDLDPAAGWSISFVGVARHLPDGDDLGPTARRSLPHWGDGGRHRLVAISTDQVSGRRMTG